MYYSQAPVPALHEAERLDHAAQQLARLGLLPGVGKLNQVAEFDDY